MNGIQDATGRVTRVGRSTCPQIRHGSGCPVAGDLRTGTVEPAAGPAESCQNGGGAPIPVPRKSAEPEHLARVAEAARAAFRVIPSVAAQNSASDGTRQDIPHGTRVGYGRHRCRCQACREAHNRDQRAYLRRSAEGLVVPQDYRGNCRKVRGPGVVFPSIAAAARGLEVSPATIIYHLRKYGHAERAGLGLRGRDAGNELVLFGRKFASVKAAAIYLGEPAWRLQRAIRVGVSPAYSDELLGKMMLADMRGRKVAA